MKLPRADVASETALASVIAGLPRPNAPMVLLSASEPYERTAVEGMNDHDVERSRHYVKLAKPQNIRAAVMAFTLAALRRGVRLIFGAHPSISPMVLAAARDASPGPGSILIFQSRFFEAQWPRSTYALADWSAGQLIVTPEMHAPLPIRARSDSLEAMRSLMVSQPLRGAIFVGGMDGVEREAALLANKPRIPRYAIASTGSAAQELFDNSRPQRYAGRLQDPELMRTCRSYSLLARYVFDDMNLTSPHGSLG